MVTTKASSEASILTRSYCGMEKLFGDSIETAHIIRERIQNELGFTVNIGISSNKLLSKVASDFYKAE